MFIFLFEIGMKLVSIFVKSKNIVKNAIPKLVQTFGEEFSLISCQKQVQENEMRYLS